MLVLIKTIHTVIWALMAAAIFYVFYAGLTATLNWVVLACILLIVVETVALLINKWSCPLTPLAARYTSERKDNFDIYLPEWLARHNKTIFTIIYLVGVLMVAYHYFKSLGN